MPSALGKPEQPLAAFGNAAAGGGGSGGGANSPGAQRVVALATCVPESLFSCRALPCTSARSRSTHPSRMRAGERTSKQQRRQRQQR
eukprot:14312424-Alexandrium_andersonii.AAC.1